MGGFTPHTYMDLHVTGLSTNNFEALQLLVYTVC